MKLAIIGSRGFTDYDVLNREILARIDTKEVDYIVSGGARGADSLAELFAKEHGIDMVVFPADWKTYGKRAGYLRNVTIIDNADTVIAFWDYESRGTKHSMDLTTSAGKTLYVVDVRNCMVPVAPVFPNAKGI